jgi:hypothetical protein
VFLSDFINRPDAEVRIIRSDGSTKVIDAIEPYGDFTDQIFSLRYDNQVLKDKIKELQDQLKAQDIKNNSGAIPVNVEELYGNFYFLLKSGVKYAMLSYENNKFKKLDDAIQYELSRKKPPFKLPDDGSII